VWRTVPSGLRTWLGVELLPVTHTERIVSAAGGFVGTAFVWLASALVLGDVEGTLFVAASMGASAVLVFAVPHGPLSQPWSLVGGHAVSALAGVACARAVPQPLLAAALAVALAIGGMHYLRCIHPPGGGTALAAVIGGPAVRELGFTYVVAPVLLNAVILVAAAIAVNAFFAWRRYPAALARRAKRPEAEAEGRPFAEVPSHGDIEYALRQINSMVDVTEDDLERIYRLAEEHSRSSRMEPGQIRAHRYYSNGRCGEGWSVRQVVDESPSKEVDEDLVIFEVVAGQGRRRRGVGTRAEFARWARHEVVPAETSWRRQGDPE
jgi:CBS-domain-containing membrane protein